MNIVQTVDALDFADIEKRGEYTETELEDIRVQIEAMDKHNHVEVLAILNKSDGVVLNSGTTGMLVNLSGVSVDVIHKLRKYIKYVKTKDTYFDKIETQKDEYRKLLRSEVIPEATTVQVPSGL